LSANHSSPRELQRECHRKQLCGDIGGPIPNGGSGVQSDLLVHSNTRLDIGLFVDKARFGPISVQKCEVRQMAKFTFERTDTVTKQAQITVEAATMVGRGETTDS
jgi:hypothetical protein